MKLRIGITIIVLLAFVFPVQVLAAQDTKAEKEVRAILEEQRQINLKGGSAAVAFFDKLLADDYVRILPNGALEGKTAMVDSLKTGNLKVEKLEWYDIQVHLFGNTAVTTGIADAKFSFNGKDLSGKNRWTRDLCENRREMENRIESTNKHSGACQAVISRLSTLWIQALRESQGHGAGCPAPEFVCRYA